MVWSSIWVLEGSFQLWLILELSKFPWEPQSVALDPWGLILELLSLTLDPWRLTLELWRLNLEQ